MDKSFDHQLSEIQSSTERCHALIAYAEQHLRKSPILMTPYGELLIQELAFIEDENLKAKSYILCGRINWYKADLSKAEHCFRQSLEYAERAENAYFIVQSFTGLGNVAADRDQYDEALKLYFDALKFAEENNITEYIVAMYNNIGEVYKRFKAFDKALEHYQMAAHFIDGAVREKNLIIEGIVNQNIAEVLISLGKYDEARLLLKFCFDQFEMQENYISMADCYNILGQLEHMDQHIERSIDYFEKSHELFEQLHDRVNHIPMLLKYSYVLEEQGRKETSEKYLLIALEYAKELDQLYQLSLVTSRLASHYEADEQYEKALSLYKDYHDIDKSYERQKTDQRLDSVRVRVESQESMRRSDHYRTTSEVYKERSEELEKAYERISLISNMGKRLTASQNLKIMYEYMYESLSRMMSIDTFMMSLYNEEEKNLKVEFLMEEKTRLAVYSIEAHNKTSLTAWCFRNNQEIISGNIVSEFKAYIEDMGNFVGNLLTKSVIYIPIQYQSAAIGVLSLQSKEENAFDAHQLEFLKALSAYIAIAINNAMKSKALLDEIEARKQAQIQLELANDRLKGLSERDGLTGVFNRHRLEEYMKDLEKLERTEIYFFMIDIDYFKNYNDHYGHLKGDEILIDVSHTLEEQFAKWNGFFARYGGEEFVGILVGVKRAKAQDIAEEILESIRRLKIEHLDSDLKILTISIGLASNSKVRSLDEAMNFADRALYLSKRTGRNKVSLHE